MRRILRTVAIVVGLACIAGVPSASAQAKTAKAKPAKAMTARGTVKSVGDATLVLDAAGKDMTFTLDNNTKAIARGAGTKARKMGGKGQVTAFVHAGDTVSVMYHDVNGAMHASQVTVTKTKS